MKIHLYQILLISFLSPLMSSAQETTKKKEILPAKLAIIAIGPKPLRRFSEAENGGTASALLPPKPGEIPPRRLYFETSEKKKSKASKKIGKTPSNSTINVTFNNPSHFIEVPPNKSLILQRRDGSEYSSYLTIGPLEPGSMTLVLLRPTGKGAKRWVAIPTQHKLNLLGKALKDKKLAILNLSHRPVKSNFHKDLKMIPSGGIQAYESIEGLELHRLAAAYGQENKIIFNTALRLNKSNRLLFYVLYDANPYTNDGRTVGLFRTSVDPEAEKQEAQQDAQQEKQSTEAIAE